MVEFNRAGRSAPSSKLGMVDSIEITNFRGFEDFKATGFAPINLIVGDNAVGKTALLEAIFLAMSGNADKGLAMKQWRGMPVSFQAGSSESVVEAIYADLFHDPDSPAPITIKITGRGFENRQVVVAKTKGHLIVPTTDIGNRSSRRAQAKKKRLQTAELDQATIAPIALTWTDENGTEHVSSVRVSPTAIGFDGTGETIPGSSMFAAHLAVPPNEAAEQYSALRKRRETEPFRRVFMSVFEDITDLSVETVANSPAILADVPWAKQLLPLAALSGGTNRAASILLAITLRRDGMVLVDEAESGIYHARQSKFAEAIVELSREYKTQVIMTTHSDEWIRNCLSVFGKNEDVAFWRMERGIDRQPRISRFTAAEFSMGLRLGEMR